MSDARRRSAARERLRSLLVDTTPLRESPQYRLLWTGQLVTFLGSQLTVVASAFQLFVLTGSSFQVGLLSLAQLPPLLIGSLVGGSLADAHDRRRLLLFAQGSLAVCSAGLAVNATVDEPATWPIYLFTAMAAALSGIDGPTRAAALPALVPAEQYATAAALNQSIYQVGFVVGPSIAGLVIGRFSLATAFWIDVATFGAALLCITRLRPLVPMGGGTKAGLGSVRAGLRYVRGEKAVQGAFAIDVNAMVFGMPRALFPEIGTRLYGGGAGTVGLLYSAVGVGGLVGALTTGWVGRVRRPGRAVEIAVVVWGLAIAGFGLTSWLPLGLLLLAAAGAADVVSAVFRNTIVQLTVPDALRGRVNALNIAVVTGGPRLGDLEAGAMAAATTPRISVVSGGLACVAGVGVLAKLLPQLRGWRAPAGSVDPS